MVNVSFPAPIDRENSKITASDTQEPIMVTLFVNQQNEKIHDNVILVLTVWMALTQKGCVYQ